MRLFNETALRQISHIPDTLPIYLFPSIDSTNTFLLAKADTGIPAFCLAETQTAGRGQRGRTWVSPQAQNIYLSYLTYQNEPLNQVQDFSFRVGRMLYEYLAQQLHISELSLKWPNDILFKAQYKLSGILVETTPHQHLTAIIIGIGLNVNMQDLPTTINQSWTSLTKITGKTYNLNDIAGDLIQALSTTFPSQLA